MGATEHEGAILILKTGEPPAPVKAVRGDFQDWIAKATEIPVEDFVVAEVYQGEALPDPARLSGVIVTGSPLMVTDRADWSEAAAAWLASLVESDRLPVLGICYGHQLIAHGLGGEVGANPKGREIGSVEIRHDATKLASDPVVAGVTAQGHMSHSESVLRAPSDAEVLAETDLEAHAALRFGPRQWGVQYHPEFDRDIMQRYIEARRGILIEEGLDPDAKLAEAVETPVVTSVMTRFVDFVAKASKG